MSDNTANQGIPDPEGAATVIQTDYEIGQDNIETNVGPFNLDIHNPVFLVSGLTIVAFVFLTLAFQAEVGPVFDALRKWLTSNLDWFFIISGNIFVLLCLALIVTPLGSVRIGGKEASPDYSYFGWFAMLFAAGMGIGLMFFGVLEPVYHMAFSAPVGVPSPFDADGNLIPENVAAAKAMGMAATIFHWGLHPWAIYAVVALALALFSYNKGLPLTMRSIFYPIFGERTWGWPGHVVDILAVFATLFGLATSLGFGAQQANAGLNFVFGVPVGNTAQIVLIIGITAVALISVLRGLDGGVKVLSEINMMIAAILLLFVILAGPTATLISGFFSNIGAYFSEIVP
ncbi:BCCT family transporter, partial [Roseibium sp.]|uniref:BCCT family transporter n=1 Tax=Roseibium sp. TaxID=1936156 RepID=UPI003D12B148